MKKMNFILQSKGGSGKSMLAYLLALKNEDNLLTYFIDFDSSVKSSTQQLKFLQGRTPARFAKMNLLDERGKIDRQRLFENLQILAQKPYEELSENQKFIDQYVADSFGHYLLSRLEEKNERTNYLH